ncbi:hypothetical protein [Limibacillus halophilus]|uniref:Uncharacterized protein n=1 Tax=Limibacillus halophilus TaxID=1579333 RepID=A0A839STN1_9PROT|nr:hypothetical protein [Limibacillus halophilus]MBB3066207.1 hypothetical protein [Limibacillus halophilus]
MVIRNKVWVGLGAALLASTSLATAALAGDTPDNTERSRDTVWSKVQLASGEAGEAGEGGEGGELSHSDSAYLTQLGLMRGHLSVGVELYGLGELANAATHMKHPEDELYESMEDALKDRGAPGFEEELETLATLVENQADNAKVQAAYAAVLEAITRAEAAAGPQPADEIAEVIYDLIHTAAEEYDEGVDDGKIVNGHEYQDALGFTRIAEALTDLLAQSDADTSLVAEIKEQIAAIKPAWPSVVPPVQATMDPSALYGAAARIEIAALSLKD